MRVRLLRGIQGKLIGLYLGLTLLSVGILTYLFERTTDRIISQTIGSHLATIAENRGDLILGWMHEREDDLQVLAKSTPVLEVVSDRAADPSRVPSGGSASLLRLVREQYGAYHEITIVDPVGAVILSTAGEGAPPVQENEALLREVRSGRLYRSDPMRYQDGAPLALEIASPIRDQNGAVLGAVVAKVDLGVVNEMTDRMQLMESGEAYLVDQRGVFITHRDRRRVFRDDISGVHGVSEVISGRSGVGEYADYRGVPVLGAFRWLPDWQWGLLAEVDQSEAFAPLANLRRYLLLIASLVVVVALLATLLLARRIVGPLGELTTRLLAANEELEQQKKLVAHSERLATLGEMAAGLAHEINNPLTTMRNLIHSLGGEMDPDDIRSRDVAIIDEEIDKMSALMASFLSYAKPASANYALIDPSAVIEHALEMAGPQARGKSLVVEVDTQDAPAFVRADRNQLNQVLLNLLLNAIHASPNGGKLRVGCRTRVSGHRERRQRMEITVSDEGHGIPSEERERIFRPFFSTKADGTGLGLATSQRIIDQHRGELSFRSRVGVGTTFAVTLPLAEGPDDDTHPDR